MSNSKNTIDLDDRLIFVEDLLKDNYNFDLEKEVETIDEEILRFKKEEGFYNAEKLPFKKTPWGKFEPDKFTNLPIDFGVDGLRRGKNRN